MTMEIDGGIIIGITSSATIAVVGFLLKKLFVERIDKLERSISKLYGKIEDLSKQNAAEHLDMEKEIARIKGRLEIHD